MATSEPTELFSAQTIRQFQEFLDAPTHSNREIITQRQRAIFRDYLNNPTVPVTGTGRQRQANYNDQHRALHSFELRDNQLWKQGKDGKSSRYAVSTYEIFERVKNVHTQLGHTGVNKTHEICAQRYYGITKVDVAWLLTRCAVCLLNKPNKDSPIKPIEVFNIMERVQVDLVDMSANPDGNYKWILQMKDHFSKYSVLYPLATKHAEPVATLLADFVANFGIPQIL
jgi:Integrase zinc binding domain